MFEENVILKNYSNYKIGGPAKIFLRAKNVDEILKGVEEARRTKNKIFVLGGGTNILFSDEIFDGLVLKPEINFIKEVFKFGCKANYFSLRILDDLENVNNEKSGNFSNFIQFGEFFNCSCCLFHKPHWS